MCPRITGTGQRDIDVTVASGLGVLVSGQMVAVASGVHVEQVSILYSGQVEIVGGDVGVSGTVTVESGVHVEEVAILYSGQVEIVGGDVGVSGTVTVESGVHVEEVAILYSGQVEVLSGLGVLISGQTVDIEVPSDVIITSAAACTSGGGTFANPRALGAGVDWSSSNYTWHGLASAAVVSVTVKALSANSGDIYVGGDAVPQRPWSGHGFMLEPGEAINLDVDNIAEVWGVAEVSGDKLCFAAVV